MTIPPAPNHPALPPSPPEAPAHADQQRQVATRVWPQVIESAQTVLTALMLAFVFRSFFVEAFIIPTGSMAESLLGQHGVLVCPNCGWEIDYGPEAGTAGRDRAFQPPELLRCPNCHTRLELRGTRPVVKAGDRILVHKWPYILGGAFEPQRWDVIVFRDPSNPAQNYIKRLVALPGEAIEIVDGDVFIKPPGASRFQIARKTPAAQSMLWFIVFDQNHLPEDVVSTGRNPVWVRQSPASQTPAGWSDLDTRTIRCTAHDDLPRALVFEPGDNRGYLQDVYGYNHGSAGNYVGDARILADLTVTDGAGTLRWELVRDGRRFAACLGCDGSVSLTLAEPGEQEVVLASTRIAALTDGRPRRFEFAHLDYRVYLKIDGREVLATTEQQYAPDLATLRQTWRVAPLGLRIVARNISLEMSSLRVDRDVHYAYSRTNTQRAYAGAAFHLHDGEYFVLGDNSPNSADSREWQRVGVNLRQAAADGSYQVGTVRADQIVGQAFFVYLPGLLPVDQKGDWRIPDLGRVRFVR